MLSVRAFSVAMSHLAWQLSVPGCPPQLESGAQAWLKNIDSGQGGVIVYLEARRMRAGLSTGDSIQPRQEHLAITFDVTFLELCLSG